VGLPTHIPEELITAVVPIVRPFLTTKLFAVAISFPTIHQMDDDCYS
jgi:hypothetical protein